MLRQLRKRNTMKRLLWTIAILIIPPFVFWGAGSLLRARQKGPSYAGIIFGKKVSFEEYNASFQATKNQALLMYGSKLNEIYDSLNLERQAWERLILLHEAKKRKIKVNDEEVIDTIKNFPFLQSKGRFDNQAYKMLLEQVFRTKPREFEEGIRGTLIISKLRDLIIKDVKITGKEVKEAYKKENEKSTISYIMIPFLSFKEKVKIGDEAIKRYYQENAENYRTEEQVNVQYIGFEFADYQKDVQVKEEEIKRYYDENKNEFDVNKKFEELKETIKNKLVLKIAKEKAILAAEKIDYALADKTKTFEDVAKENSIPIKETGFFTKQGLIPNIGWFPEFQKTAFKLEVGEVSDLIKSDADFVKGYYIIKLKEKKPPYIPALEEVRTRIENTLKDEEAARLASKEADRLHKKILELMKTKKFEEAAAIIKHKAKKSEPFTRNDYIPGVGLASEIGEAAFTLRPGELSPVIKTRAGYCIFTVVEITPIDERQFKKKRKEFTNATLEEKKARVLNEWYSNLLRKANLKDFLSPS